jgi:hypothetical protein
MAEKKDLIFIIKCFIVDKDKQNQVFNPNNIKVLAVENKKRIQY